jgi:hypothetical protein
VASEPLAPPWPASSTPARRFVSNGQTTISGIVLVLVTGEVMWPVRHKQQLCYLVCIQEIDDGTEFFYTVKRNFKVDLPPPLLPLIARHLRQQLHLLLLSLTMHGSGSHHIM